METPTWELTIPKDIRVLSDHPVYVIQGDGVAPVARKLTPSVGPPPGARPLDITPRPGEDMSGFVFPEGGPTVGYQDGDRSYHLGEAYPESDYYATLAGNPVGVSHRWAGKIRTAPEGVFANLPEPKNVSAMNLYVRVVAGEGMSGEPLPPAPGYLIRRALNQGHIGKD